MAESSLTLVRKWIALLDAAEHLRQSADPHDPCAMKRVGMAIDALFRFEHTLSDAQRERARRLLWQRDKAAPLPADTSEWQHCRCRRCRFTRFTCRLGGSSQAVPPPLASGHLPAPVGEPLSPPPHEATQGDLFPCSC
jgi:hypothetical protein